VKFRILILVIGLLVAAAARRFVSTSSGLTYTALQATKYVSYNVVLFWLVIVVTVVLCLLPSKRT
jgi:hypothetical protein